MAQMYAQYPQTQKPPNAPLGRAYDDLEAHTTTCVYDCEAAVKAGFLRKVYGILSIQLLVTVAGAALFMFQEDAHQFVLRTPSAFYVALFMPFGFLLALHCYKDRHPINMYAAPRFLALLYVVLVACLGVDGLCGRYLLAAFTLCESYTIGVICAIYQENNAGIIVFQAFVLTAAIFIALTTYVLVTKKDFSFLGAGLFSVLIVLLMCGMMQAFFPALFGFTGHVFISVVGALLFAGYILYDTSQILHNLGPDDYVVAAINLYLDIINLFLYLLEILRMLQGGND